MVEGSSRERDRVQLDRDGEHQDDQSHSAMSQRVVMGGEEAMGEEEEEVVGDRVWALLRLRADFHCYCFAERDGCDGWSDRSLEI